MKTAQWLMFLVAILISQTSLATETQHPPGVDVRAWIPISEGFGFVVTESKASIPNANTSEQLLLADPQRIGIERMPPKKGYFVIKTSAGWQPVVVSEPVATQ